MKRSRVTLTIEESKELESLIAAWKGTPSKLLHARILLSADQAANGPEWEDLWIAEAVECGTATVKLVRRSASVHLLLFGSK